MARRVATSQAQAFFVDHSCHPQTIAVVRSRAGPLGWTVFDEAIDVAAMVATTIALGFHVLFLPTFVVEFLPVTDMLPTWTGCVLAVAVLRRKSVERPDSGPRLPST